MFELLKLVQEHKWSDVLALMSEKHIKVKEKGNLAIFNYDISCDFADPVVCEARGIILDKAEQKIVCRGFDKFFNFSEPYAAVIDWSTARVQEKIDGSIVKMYWYDNAWYWSTNGMINAEDASVADGLPVLNFMDIIAGCENYQTIVSLQETLNKDNTYIFELVSPYTRIVVPYKTSMLYHIGTRSNVTGLESKERLPIVCPKEYSLMTLDDCVRAVSELNNSDIRVDHEGFVVVDDQFRRIKIKSPEYVYLHHTLNNRVMTKGKILELIDNEDFNVDAFLLEFPEYKEWFEYYRTHLTEVRQKLANSVEYARHEYEASSGNRKVVWEKMQTPEWRNVAFAGMMGVGNNRSIAELLQRIPVNKLYDMIPDLTADQIT